MSSSQPQPDENTPPELRASEGLSAQPESGFSRRSFLGRTGGAAGVAAALRGAGALGLTAGAANLALSKTANATDIGPLVGEQRRRQAYKLRNDAAKFQYNQPLPAHPDNGDEALYADKRGNFHKMLPHNDLGEVDLAAYGKLITALQSGKTSDFNAIPVGNPFARLKDPQACYAFELHGPDSHALYEPPAPAFASAWRAGEMVECYWHALLRDVPFSEYSTNPLVAEACADLSNLSDFRGPKIGGKVTPATLFRHSLEVGLVGPYISQMFFQPFPYGAIDLTQRWKVPVANQDYMTEFQDYLGIQRGLLGAQNVNFDPILRHFRNGRDLGEWVHKDWPYQAALNAVLYLVDVGSSMFDPANPYFTNPTQCGFATFGLPYFQDVLARSANPALKAQWYQKWLVHRTLRPEVYAARVHNTVVGAKAYDVHADVLNSVGLSRVQSRWGSSLLPQAFPEGSPAHPAYASGHATFVGATFTMLKAMFNEDAILPNPVVPNADGTALVPYTGPALSVGNELNKMASNVAFGRNFAGVHWRTDAVEAMYLGEQLAILMLQDLRNLTNEEYAGFSLTTFDGNQIVI